MKRIAVLGANGQLGSDICTVFQEVGWEVVPMNHDLVEVSELDSVMEALKNGRPDVLINTAAYHNVESCEANPILAFKVNALGAKNLCYTCREFGTVLVHVSTDYVFDGHKMEPYLESDKASPINVYGISKLAGEQFVAAYLERFFIIRVSGLYGEHPCRAKKGMNFVKLMLKLGKERPEVRVIDDEILTPTYTLDVAKQLVELLDTEAFGTYHMTAQGSCSWYGFAKRIFDIAGIRTPLKVASPDEFAGKAPRPKYSVLENAMLKSIGKDVMPSWEESLEAYLQKLL